MSRKLNRKSKDDIRPEYDFTGGVRGKFYKEYMRGTNVVLLDPDVAAVFPDAVTVNDALRSLAQLAKRQVKSRTRKAKTA
jgi:hypothetical protein